MNSATDSATDGLAEQREHVRWIVDQLAGGMCTCAICFDIFKRTGNVRNNFLAVAYNGSTTAKAPVKPTGHRCSSCKVFNEFAASNRPDGTYVCFECR